MRSATSTSYACTIATCRCPSSSRRSRRLRNQPRKRRGARRRAGPPRLLAKIDAHFLRRRRAGRLALRALLQAARQGDLVVALLLEVDAGMALLAALDRELARRPAAVRADGDLVE